MGTFFKASAAYCESDVLIWVCSFFFFLPLPLTAEAQQASLNLNQLLEFASLCLLLTFLWLVDNIYYIVFTVTVTSTVTFFFFFNT